MSQLKFAKELFITQISSGFVSFLASSAIVIFVALKGFSSPYRRIIFGLSVSDIFQSLGVVSGPFFMPSDVPQALYGLGNMQTCQFSGFLLLVGMNAVPMYTMCLCIYYVCKCKNKMTDAQFARRVETKMHSFIIVTTLSFYFIALGMGTINPGAMGNMCLPAAVPTGCRVDPVRFGECDPFIEKASHIFNVISTTIIPSICLAGIIGCLAILFWNVILVERISGGMRTPSDAEPLAQGRGEMQRNRFLRSIEDDGFIDSVESSEFTSMTGYVIGVHVQESACVEQHSSHQATSPDESANQTAQTIVLQSTPKERNDQSVLRAVPEEVNNLENIAEESSPPSPTSFDANRHLGTVSRRYKRELVTQALLYVLAFSLTTLPFLASNFILLSGMQIPRALMRTVVILYPMAGIFNIIIYTRLNVASFRNRHPECSRLKAFLLVLRAGGESPSDDDWNQRSDCWNLKCCCNNRPSSGNVPNSNLRANSLPKKEKQDSLADLVVKNHPSNDPGDEERGDLEEHHSAKSEPLEEEHEENSALVEDQSTQHSDIKCKRVTLSKPESGTLSKKIVGSSLPDSALGMNGLSMSFDDENPAHRPCDHWEYARGEISAGERLESKVITSMPHSVFPVGLSSLSNASFSQFSLEPDGGDKVVEKTENEDMWANTFERVKKWQPSLRE